MKSYSNLFKARKKISRKPYKYFKEILDMSVKMLTLLYYHCEGIVACIIVRYYYAR